MKNYEELKEYDLLAKVCFIKTEFGGRQGAVLDGYRGQFCMLINRQFFWHMNVKKHFEGVFPVEHQFGIRDGSVGLIVKNNIKKVTLTKYQ